MFPFYGGLNGDDFDPYTEESYGYTNKAHNYRLNKGMYPKHSSDCDEPVKLKELNAVLSEVSTEKAVLLYVDMYEIWMPKSCMNKKLTKIKGWAVDKVFKKNLQKAKDEF